MKRILKTPATLILIGLFLAVTGGSAFASHNYVIANNNTAPTNTVTIYELSGTTVEASLVSVTTVATGGSGTGTGYPSNTSVATVIGQVGACVFVGDAGTGDISAMKSIHSSPYLEVVGNVEPPDGDSASEGGLGMIVGSALPYFLYANYTGDGGNISPAIGV